MTPIPKLDPNEVVLDGPRFSRLVYRWVSRVTSRGNGEEPTPLKSYTVARLPAASDFPNCAVVVSDDVGGVTIALSDGANWRRVKDNATVTT